MPPARELGALRPECERDGDLDDVLLDAAPRGLRCLAEDRLDLGVAECDVARDQRRHALDREATVLLAPPPAEDGS